MRTVDDAKALLARVVAASPAPALMVGFSGGKDSIATLDLALQVFPRVEAFFMYLVPGLRVEDEMIRRVMARFPTVKLHRIPHWDLSTYMRSNTFGCNPRAVETKKLDLAKIEAYLRQRTGIDWFAYGERAADGMVRNAKLKKIRGLAEKQRRVYPLWTWKERDVVGYLHAKRLPVPRKIGGRKVSGAVAIHPQVLSWLKREYPDDYAKVLGHFPLAGAAVFRWEEGLTPDKRGRYFDGSKKDPIPQELAVPRGRGEALEVPEVSL